MVEDYHYKLVKLVTTDFRGLSIVGWDPTLHAMNQIEQPWLSKSNPQNTSKSWKAGNCGGKTQSISFCKILQTVVYLFEVDVDDHGTDVHARDFHPDASTKKNDFCGCLHVVGLGPQPSVRIDWLCQGQDMLGHGHPTRISSMGAGSRDGIMLYYGRLSSILYGKPYSGYVNPEVYGFMTIHPYGCRIQAFNHICQPERDLLQRLDCGSHANSQYRWFPLYGWLHPTHSL